MAAVGSKRKRSIVNYKDLNAISSAVLYDTARKSKGKFFEVDRLIEKRKVGHNKEYLVKWKGWPLQACSWEPEDHLTPALLRTYEKPVKPDSYRLEMAGGNFYHAMLTSVKGKSSAPVDVQIDFDVQRYLWGDRGVVSEHPGYKLYHKEDFFRFTTLPESWWYYLDLHGQGKSVDFPLKMKPLLSWTAVQYIKDTCNGMLKQAPRAPVEKVIIHFCKKACNITKL